MTNSELIVSRKNYKGQNDVISRNGKRRLIFPITPPSHVTQARQASLSHSFFTDKGSEKADKQ